MGKTYDLLATLNPGRQGPNNWSNESWTNFEAGQASNVGKCGYDSYWYYATNMVFDADQLSTLAAKNVSSVTLELDVTRATNNYFYIGFKYNSTSTGNVNSQAWARSDNHGNLAGDATSVATVDNPSFTSLSLGTNTLTLREVPQYGLVAGPRKNFSNVYIFSSAVLHVTTDEVTVSYNKGANGIGTNATVTKGDSETITLAGAIFTRSGYVQTGWSTTDGGAKAYNLEASYSGSSDLTLYPYWTAQYTVSFNANGGTGAPASVTKLDGVNITLPATAPTRTNYIFQGWSTSSTGVVQYQPSDTFSTNANTVLYAIWAAASSTLSSVTSPVEIGSSGTASWSVVSASYSYSLSVTYSTAPAVTVTAAANTSSVSFTIPATWYAYIPNATSVTATATLTTLNGGTAVGTSSLTFTVSVPTSIKPSISAFTASHYSANATVSGWGVYTQGYSKADLSATATAGNGASIVSYAFSGPGVNQSGASSTVRSSLLDSAGSKTYTLTVTDSRGRTATDTVSITVYGYSAPVISSLASYRCLPNGTQADTDGTYIHSTPVFSFSSVNSNNSLTVKKIEYKLHTASTWTSGVADAVSGTGYTFGGGNIDVLYTYDVKCTVTDAVGSTSTLTVNISSMGGFSIGLNNDRARFGGPVEEAGLVVDWDATFKGAINGQGFSDLLFGIGNTIANGTNCNTLKAEGKYTCPSSSIGGTLSNAPYSSAFGMFVFRVAESQRLIQVAFPNNSTITIKIRYYSGSSWSAWKTLTPS